MLYCFGFESVGVVVGDIYFEDPEPLPGQESPEHGVRLEVRRLERGELHGDIYSAQPIAIDLPIWRADLLESIDGRPGSYNRTHHHPHVDGWNLGGRDFQEELSSDPLPWVGRKLADLESLLAMAGITDVDPADANSLRQTVPEILDVSGRLLDRVRAGELGLPPRETAGATLIRSGWL